MKKFSVRLLTQAFILGLVVFLAISHQRFGIEKAASIDAYCPFGALEGFITFITTGEFLKRIYWSSFILLGIFIFANIFFGRVFCSYVCPLGALQEWIRRLGRFVGIKKSLELPRKYDKFLRLIKYAILIIVMVASFLTVDLFLLNNGPFSALMHFGREFEEKIIGYIVLGALLVVALFSKSLWCRYFCPLGAFFGILNKVSFQEIKRDSKSCVSCGICDITCPANLNVQTVEKVKDADCIACGNCVKDCPKGSLRFKILGKGISKRMFEIFVLFFVFLPLFIVPFTPIWKTKILSNVVSEDGIVDANNIRGSNTLKYLIEKTEIPFKRFQQELGLPEDVDMKMKLKDIGPTYNLKNREGAVLETEDFRDIVRYSK